MANRAELLIVARMRDEVSRVAKDIGGTIERNAQTIRKASMVTAAAGAAITGAMLLMTKSAYEEQIGIAKLDTALKSVNLTYADVKEGLERQIRATQLATGIGDEMQREIVARLIPTMGNYEDALKAMPLILDAAAFSGKSLNTIIETGGRALAGQTNTMISAGVTFEKETTRAERFAIVQALIGDQAEALKNPFTALTGAVNDLGQAIATPLLPALTELLGTLEKTALALADMDPQLMKIVGYAITAAGAFATIGGAVGMAVAQLAILKIAGVAWAGALLAALGWIALPLAAIGVSIAAIIAQFDEFKRGLEVIQHYATFGLTAMPEPLGMAKLGPATQRVVTEVNIQGGPLLMTDEKAMALLADKVAEAQRHRARGTTGRLP